MSGQSEYKTRVTRLSVLPPGVQALGDIHDGGMINIDPNEWPALRAAIDRMIWECRDDPQDRSSV
jgi:hypothetical protein